MLAQNILLFSLKLIQNVDYFYSANEFCLCKVPAKDLGTAANHKLKKALKKVPFLQISE